MGISAFPWPVPETFRKIENKKIPKDIDYDLVRSQEARRILDRIIGFRLSKLMQSKTGGKSAGRVQSVALKLIVDREREINAFNPEEYWTITALFDGFNADLEKYKNKKLPIKTVLLDQSIITGIGNIYADEILYLSKINPLTKALDLTDDNLDDIITNTRCVLNNAISLGGTSIHSYKSVDGISGKFQNCLLVHGKEGSSCNVCMEKIVKIKVGGRGTYYCPNCQKLKK